MTVITHRTLPNGRTRTPRATTMPLGAILLAVSINTVALQNVKTVARIIPGGPILMSDKVVQFDVNRRRHQIEQQEKRASDALLAASREFKRLAELKAK